MADNPNERDNPEGAADDAATPEPREEWPGRVEDGPYAGDDQSHTDADRATSGEHPLDDDAAPREDAASDPAAPQPPTAEPYPPSGAAGGAPDGPERGPVGATVPVQTTAASGDDAVTSSFDLRERPGHHQAERPVPRSGLTEHRSAGYLTGELTPPEPVATSPAAPTREPSADEQDALSPRPDPAAEPAPGREAGGSGQDTAVVLEGATVPPRMPSRAGAHVWTVLLTLVLTPVAWYLLADAGARLTRPTGNPWDTANLNIAALLELAGGLLVLAVVLLAARWSSLGAIITGSLLVVVGVPFLAVPAWTQELLGPVTDWLQTLGGLGDNTAAHLVATGSTGRFVVYGLALILLGVVSHGARRQGRREMHTALTA